MCEKDDNPAHQKSRFFIARKGLGLSLENYFTLKKSFIKRFIYPMSSLLYHKRNPLISTVVDVEDITNDEIIISIKAPFLYR